MTSLRTPLDPTTMEDLAEIARIRERFLQDRETDLSGIRPVVARSWYRSAAASVDPSPHREVIEAGRVDEKTLSVASPILEELRRLAGDVGGYVTIVDPNGCLVDDASIQFPNGYVLREDYCGTNGDGTALEEGRGLWIHSKEHYRDDMQDTSCFTVLVRDQFRRNVRACIGLTLPEAVAISTDPRATVLMLEGYAARIAGEIAARASKREQALFEAYLRATRQHGRSAVVAVDGKTHIVSDAALALLGQADYPVISSYAHDAIGARRATQHEVILSDDREIRLEITPAGEREDPVGAIVLVRQISDSPTKSGTAAKIRAETAVPNDAADASHSRRGEPGLEGLVGKSVAFRSAMQQAEAAIQRRTPVHLIGERGVGKYELATRIAHGFGSKVTHVPCHVPDSDNIVDVVRDAIGEGATIVLRRADMLSSGVAAALGTLLNDRNHQAVVATLRRPTSAVSQLLATLGSSEIAILPLRMRRDDIPPLVRHFLADVTDRSPSAHLLGALTQADWHGNVRQLRSVVNDAAAGATGSLVSTEDLPQAFQRSAAPGRLSRLEEAEMHELRNALEEANGNRSLAADILQIGRSTLYRRLDFYQRRGIAI